MIMLVESVPIQKKNLLKRPGISVENQIMLGMKVMIMTVPILDKLRKRQEARLINRITVLLREFRINTVHLKHDFPYPEWFRRYRSLDGKELTKRLLGKITINTAKSFEAVYIHVNRYDRSSFNAITELCQKFRIIMLSGKNGDIADRLYNEYGVSIIVAPTHERIMTADAAVLFSEPDEMPEFNEDCIVIKPDDSLYIELGLINGMKMNIPEGYPQIPLISEAIRKGSIGFDDICIMKSEISP